MELVQIFIYKISNTINSKVYIGQTIRPIEQRFKRHISDAINNVLDTHFARAIRLYGADNFYIELIDTANSQEELNRKEQYWIRYFNSIHDGYNETDAIFKSGGNTYQSKTSDDMKTIKEKLKLSKMGSENPNSHSVKCKNISTGEELFFDTIEECKRHFGESTHRFITTRVGNKTRGLYRGEWAIAYTENEYVFEKVVNKKGRKIHFLDSDNGIDREFNSIRCMCREYGINRSEVHRHIKNGETKFTICGRYIITILD